MDKKLRMPISALYRGALNKWGIDFQYMMLIEEMAELTQVLTHAIRGKRAAMSGDRLAEEIADVQLMIGQVVSVHALGARVQKFKGEKLIRLQDLVFPLEGKG